MRFGSVCSGIEAASVAWHPLGWTTAYVAEIEPFPCMVLAQRHGASRPRYLPEGVDARPFAKVAWGDRVPNYGDFTRIADEAPALDVLVGGTPCQAFSVAGARLSLADDRGNLTLEFVRLVHATPDLKWAVWENVPGVLSTDDNAFGCFLAGLVGGDDPLRIPGGGRWTDSGMVSGPLGRAAWRILDAQHFGLAQRRRRVFLVFCPRAAGRDPIAVLFERAGLSWHSTPSSEAGEGIASGVDAGPDGGVCAGLAPALTSSGRGVPRPGETRGQDPVVAAYGGNNTSGPIGVATACSAHGGPHGRLDFESETFIAHTLRADGFDASEDGTGRGTPLVPVTFSITPSNSNKDYNAREVDRAQSVTTGPGTPSARSCDLVLHPAHAFDARQSDVIQYGDKTGPLDTDGSSVGVLTAIAFQANASGSGHMSDTRELAPTMRHGRGGGSSIPAVAIPIDMRQASRGATMTNNRAEGSSGGAPGTGIGEDGDPAPTIACTHIPAIAASAVRRLTPRECERLQGFPDDYTRIRIRKFTAQRITKKRPADMWDRDPEGGWWLMAADGPRYKALGNSMADTVMSWLGQRIAAYEAGTLDGWRFDWTLIPWVLRPGAAQQGSAAAFNNTGQGWWNEGKTGASVRATGGNVTDATVVSQ